MNMFEEIEKVKKDFPNINNINKELKKNKLNIYQKFSIGVFIICLVIGVFLGNLFPACRSAYSFNPNCTNTEFNITLMIEVWSISLLVCVFFYAVGHIINILNSIKKKLDKLK